MRVVAFNTAHDSSVCSYVDGQIEFYCKEERLSRVKRDKMPYQSLDLYQQQNFGHIDHFLYLTPSDISADDLRQLNYTGMVLDTSEDYGHLYTYIKKKFGCELENNSRLTHHTSHASAAFYNSGFSEALVVVIDRNGSYFFGDGGLVLGRESESVFKVSYPDNFSEIYKSFWLLEGRKSKSLARRIISQHYGPSVEIGINNEFGIVLVYEAATTLIGEDPLENGKTMGLSSYGKKRNYKSLFLDGHPIGNYFSFIPPGVSCFYGDEEYLLGRRDDLTEDNYQFYADKAKHVQIETQKESLKLIKRFVNQTGIKNVCIVGGYGLNVVANNYYIKNSPDINFYFEPLADDSGISIGASMLRYREVTQDSTICPVQDNFYHYYNGDGVKSGDKKSIQDIVDLINDQKVVAIFQGSPEAGPRALGHRSLLFDPRNKDGKDIMNTLKRREWYRPFAGVIMEEHFSSYFKTLGLKKSEYMTINFECKTKTSQYVPSIVHVDNTCRIQTVNSGFLYNLLSLFYEQTGCPMLMNTSFNLAGHPLVHSVDDAYQFVDEMKDNPSFGGVYFVDSGILVS